jgi:S1-C subfamily serine protease
MTRYSKKLMLLGSTVRGSVLTLLVAVFFSSSAFAVDSSLYSLESSLSELIYHLSRSLVTIEASSLVKSQMPSLNGNPAVRNLVASGLIVDSSGHILAAAESVVGQDHITVKMDSYALPARIVGIDFHHMVALLEVDQPIGQPVTYSERHTCAGQMIIAVGNSYGVRVSPALGICAGARDNGDLQFSVPVTSGSIGGGVFDLSGHLIGLVLAAMGEKDQVTVAVPAYKLAASVDYLKSHGHRYAGFMGIAMSEIEVTPPVEIASSSRLAALRGPAFEHIDAGIQVTSVLPASPAARAGIRRGDVIFAVGDRRIASRVEMSNVIQECDPGMTINVELLRTNRHLSVPLTVGRRDPGLINRPSLGPGNSNHDQRSVTDSLAQAIRQLRDQIDRLEQRLNSID